MRIVTNIRKLTYGVSLQYQFDSTIYYVEGIVRNFEHTSLVSVCMLSEPESISDVSNITRSQYVGVYNEVSCEG